MQKEYLPELLNAVNSDILFKRAALNYFCKLKTVISGINYTLKCRTSLKNVCLTYLQFMGKKNNGEEKNV